MEKKETERLMAEAFDLIDQSALIPEEKENLKRNIEYFMSIVKNDKHLAGCKWAWFDEKEDGHGLDLVWEWKDVNGVFGFYADNGHGFSFEFGPKGTSCWFGGEGGEYGFSCGLFVRDLEDQLNYIDYVKLQKQSSARIHKKNGRTMQRSGDFAPRHTIDDFRY